MAKKTVLVASRHPHLEDVRKHVLVEAGYEVISVRNPEEVVEACRDGKIDLAVIGDSVTTAEKRLIAAEVIILCACPILELWDREPPKLGSEGPVLNHHSLTPEDFLDAVNAILGGTPWSKQPTTRIAS